MEKFLQSNNKNNSFISHSRNHLIYDELNYDKNLIQTKHNQLFSIMKRFSKTERLFFVYDYGGIGGRTTHSKIHIPKDVDQDVICNIKDRSSLSFGGKVLVLGRYFRQILLVILNGIGDSLRDIINNTYPSLLENIRNTFFQHRTILASTNDIVYEFNEYIISDDEHTHEFLNTIVASRLPNYKLKLKIGLPIMLLINKDQSSGLFNDTRLIVIQLGNHVLEAKVIFGNNIGQKVFIPRLTLIPTNIRIPFQFHCKCFLCIDNKEKSMTISQKC
ncbi:hypothetical protein HKD37_07G019394 [Glycine soja]